MGQKAKPGLCPVRSYQIGLDAHVERSGTGTAFDLPDAKVCLSPYSMYFRTYVPLSFDFGSLTRRITRLQSAARTTGLSISIGLCTSGWRYFASTGCTLPSPALTILTLPDATSARVHE
jgi:hypothetical protein